MAIRSISREAVLANFDEIHATGTRLAGQLPDLVQRATVYRQLFRDSGGNHIFPLIAAHGALWAGGYFRWGLRLGRLLAWQFPIDAAYRAAQLKKLDEFADAFRDINRRVCVETYTQFHFAATWGDHPAATELIPPAMLEALCRMHGAKRQGRRLTDAEKRFAFEAHFLNEQQHIVGPALARALESFDWPLVKSLALKPPIRFAYFNPGRMLWFGNFGSKDERIANGLAAFDLAAAAGWECVERSLAAYRVLPSEAFAAPDRFYADLARRTLGLG